MAHAALTIFLKDLRLRLRDRSVYVFAFVVPLGLTFVFAMILPAEEEFRLRATVVDEDGGPVADGFGAVIDTLVSEGLVELTPAASEADASQLIEDRQIAAAWVIPSGFTESVTSGQGGEIRVLFDPDRALPAEVAHGVAEAYRTQLDRVTLAVATTMTATSGGADVERVIESALSSSPLVGVRSLAADRAQLDPTSYLAAGMAVFFLFFIVQYGVTGLLEERDQHTLPRLLAAPISPAAVHLGKAAGAFAVGIVSMAVLAVASSLLLGARWGAPAGVAILTLAAVVSALGLMALVGSFARTSEQAGNLQSIAALVFGLTGGVFFPVGTGWLANLSLISPHGWFLRGLGDLAGAGTWTATLPAVAALTAFGMVAGALGALRLRGAA